MTCAWIVKTFTSFFYSICYDKSVVFKYRYLLLINVLIDFCACTELIWSMIREYWIKPRQRLNPLWNRGLMQRQLFPLFDTGMFLNRAYWNNLSNYFMTTLHEFCVSNRVSFRQWSTEYGKQVIWKYPSFKWGGFQMKIVGASGPRMQISIDHSWWAWFQLHLFYLQWRSYKFQKGPSDDISH